MRIRPGTLTAIGVTAGIVTPLITRRGGVFVAVAAVLVLTTAGTDVARSALTVHTGRRGARGQVFDALGARIAEGAWLWAFYVLGAMGGVVVLAGALSWMHEYVRAKAVGEGMTEPGMQTLGERNMRVLIAVIGFVVAGAAVVLGDGMSAGFATGIASLAATAWALLGALGFVQLLIVVGSTLR
ncbi:CDP-alcohol phosphatidyltransferase family protein [Phytomonospora sp. NPDC050363]|uniref:CDP-alcohol phosphatidyltransferase family protein n=1 Tax=Phytomonospora sp. NPDC050363 TaxID=3155642 RepID=UPI0033E727EE